MVPRRTRGKALAAAPTKRKKRALTSRRCRNCDTPFAPSREWQEFCADDCRKEFHRAGGVSIGRLTPIIEQMVREAIRPHLESIRQEREAIQMQLRKALNV